MMAKLQMMVGVFALAFALAAAPVTATEDRFIYVDRMPSMQGEPESREAYEDPENGHRVVQTLYSEEFEHAFIKTYLFELACLDEAETALRTYIVAVKYPPKKPSSFAVATLHDVFKEVYVEDWNGRIRLYEDVGGQAMLTLTERFKPTCSPI
ncbi:MAG: hypothetical protein AAGA21_09080 [Pseudomonadota bacterium]